MVSGSGLVQQGGALETNPATDVLGIRKDMFPSVTSHLPQTLHRGFPRETSAVADT